MTKLVTRHDLDQLKGLMASELAGLRDLLARGSKGVKGEDGADAVVDYAALESRVQAIADNTLATMRLPKDGLSIKGDQGVRGAEGPQGPIGPMPEHEWRGTELRFEIEPGEWGRWVDLQGPAGKDGRIHTSYSVVNQDGGGTGTSDGSVPYFIASGEVFTVPIFRQALFARTIDCLGIIDLSGDLVLVN